MRTLQVIPGVDQIHGNGLHTSSPRAVLLPHEGVGNRVPMDFGDGEIEMDPPTSLNAGGRAFCCQDSGILLSPVKKRGNDITSI